MFLWEYFCLCRRFGTHCLVAWQRKFISTFSFSFIVLKQKKIKILQTLFKFHKLKVLIPLKQCREDATHGELFAQGTCCQGDFTTQMPTWTGRLSNIKKKRKEKKRANEWLACKCQRRVTVWNMYMFYVKEFKQLQKVTAGRLQANWVSLSIC